MLRGIEIYKGKPIFYSLANFIFQNETLPFQPQETYTPANQGLTALPADFFDWRSGNDTRGFPVDVDNWDSVIAQVAFNADRQLTGFELYPISLGYKTSRTARGRPVPANPQDARRIIEEMTKLSEPFGTKITFDGAKGVWTPAATARQAR